MNNDWFDNFALNFDSHKRLEEIIEASRQPDVDLNALYIEARGLVRKIGAQDQSPEAAVAREQFLQLEVAYRASLGLGPS